MIDDSESSDRCVLQMPNSDARIQGSQTRCGADRTAVDAAIDPLLGHSEMHTLLRQHGWANSPLGAPETWSQSLKTIVKLMLASPFPMFVCWGPQFSTLYNTAYIQILGARHPSALGRPAPEIWPEVRDWLLSVFSQVLGGETIYHQDRPFTLLRNGYPEKTWFTFSYSPFQDDNGCNAGVVCICSETTEQVLVQRQQQFYWQLAEALREAASIDQVLARSSELLGCQLEASRVLFGDYDPQQKTITYFSNYTNGSADQLTGTYPAALFGLDNFADIERGETWVAENLATDSRSCGPQTWPTFEALQIRAAVMVPVRRHGALTTCLFVNQAEARRWSRAEIGLIEDTAERSSNAIERLRAESGLRQLDENQKAQLIAERDRLQQLLSHAPGFVAFVRGPQHIFETANQSYYQLVGHRPLIGKPVLEAIPEIAQQGYARLLDQVFASKKPFIGREMKAQIQAEPDGALSEAYVDFVMQPMLEADGTVAGIFIQGHDVTAYKLAREQVRIANERWELAIESTGDGVWDWNVDPAKTMCSACLKEILGFAPDDTELDHYQNWEARIHRQDASRVKDRLKACLSGSIASFRVEYRFRCKNGDWKWVESRGMVVERDATGRAVRAIGMLSDISEKKKIEAQQWQHANFDTLTGLPNRRLFRDRLDQSVKKATRDGRGLALFFIDLDRFKEANDLLGHDVGDLLLIEAAKRIAGSVRASDTVARLGGDEFTVILNDWEEEAHIELAAQKIIHALAQPFAIGQEVVYLSASVGITLYSKDTNSSSELIKYADQAMYAAKNAGRNRFSYFTREMQQAADLRFRLSSDLREALDRQQLEVYYQPVIELASGRIVKAEALLRWRHPKWGLIEPAQFIPLAEETGQITKIGNWVFEQAAACSQRWGAQRGETFQIAVNKSPAQFMTWHDEGSWITHLRTLGLDGASLAIEITEGLLLKASPLVKEKLARYRKAGVQIGLDDFGTGYSSMAYLRKFDIDYLKIDQSFISGIPSDEDDLAVAESIILMARRLGMTVVAEGIETEVQNTLLTAAGCDFGQGFLFSKAVPADDFEQLLLADWQVV